MRTSRGRNYASMIYGRSMAGTLEATLVNFDGDYDRFATSDSVRAAAAAAAHHLRAGGGQCGVQVVDRIFG